MKQKKKKNHKDTNQWFLSVEPTKERRILIHKKDGKKNLNAKKKICKGIKDTHKEKHRQIKLFIKGS